jgi:predicted metal-dependent HD superfamily phosphohydrolase
MDALRASWQRAWGAVGAVGDDGLRVELSRRYSEPHRSYHTLQHLAECLAALEPALGLAEHPGEVELALWFHDAVYDPRAEDNESRSADLAARALLDAGVPPEVADRVRGLILATRHAEPPATADEQILVDVDLSILGAPPPRFDEYERQVRREYAWAPDDLFRGGRRAILQGFLGRPHIYGTPHFREALEARARENLRRSIRGLGG